MNKTFATYRPKQQRTTCQAPSLTNCATSRFARSLFTRDFTLQQGACLEVRRPSQNLRGTRPQYHNVAGTALPMRACSAIAVTMPSGGEISLISYLRHSRPQDYAASLIACTLAKVRVIIVGVGVGVGVGGSRWALPVGVQQSPPTRLLPLGIRHWGS